MRIERRIILLVCLIVALAFAYRAAIMAERAGAPVDVSRWDPLPEGTDQNTYIRLLRELQSGEFPPQVFFWQPGIVYFLGAVAALIGSSELLHLRLVLVALASLNCGLMALITMYATGRWRAGLIAGLLLALYPVGAFYDTDFVITSQALILATLMLASAWFAYIRPRNLFFPFLSGLLLGAGVITRFELAAPGIVCVLWLLFWRRRARGRRGVGGALLALLGALLIIAPIALHNRAGGADYLITPVGPRLVYHGNNRDASGLMRPSNAEDSTSLDYFHYLLQDIKLEPARFIQLQLHKLAFLLSSIEGGNNLDFQKSGVGVSVALAHNPLSFPLLFLLFIAGLRALRRDDMWPLAGLLLAAFAGYCMLTLLTVVESRTKTAVIAWMMPAAGYAVDNFIARFQPRRITTRWRHYSAWLAGALAFLFLIRLGVTELPADVTVSELPPDATAAGLVYDNTLELVGWKVQAQYSPVHTIEPYHPWVVSLYWRLLRQTETDYSFSLKYYIDDEVVIEYDRPLGYTVFPRDYTSEWQAGVIYVEHIGLAWRGYSGPFERTGQVNLDVYPERDAHRLLWPRGAAGSPQDRPVLARPAILLAPGRNELETVADVSFGDVLFLLGYELPAAAAPNESVPVTTAWRTGEQAIDAAYSIGVYAFLNGAFLANSDGSPANGALQTFSLLPRYHFDDKKILTLPETAGLYDIFIGVYDLDTMQRLPVNGRDDNLFQIGKINVK